MSEVIEKLIDEMVVDCDVCHEGYIYNSKDYDLDEPKECPHCDGKGKTISWEGEKLRHLILRGELP